MLLVVDAAHTVGDIVDRGRDQIQVGDDHGSREHHIEPHRAAQEGVVGVGGQHVHILLRGGLYALGGMKDILKEAKVHIGTARSVVAVGSNDVLALVQQGTLAGTQRMGLALQPCLAGSHDPRSIDKKLKDIIVAVLHPQVFLQVFGLQRHRAAHVDVGVGGRPGVAHMGVLTTGAPRGLLH